MVQPAGAAAVVVVWVTMGVPEEENPAQHRVTSINQHPNSGKWHGPSEQHGTRRVQGGMKLIQEEGKKEKWAKIKPKSGKQAQVRKTGREQLLGGLEALGRRVDLESVAAAPGGLHLVVRLDHLADPGG